MFPEKKIRYGIIEKDQVDVFVLRKAITMHFPDFEYISLPVTENLIPLTLIEIVRGQQFDVLFINENLIWQSGQICGGREFLSIFLNQSSNTRIPVVIFTSVENKDIYKNAVETSLIEGVKTFAFHKGQLLSLSKNDTEKPPFASIIGQRIREYIKEERGRMENRQFSKEGQLELEYTYDYPDLWNIEVTVLAGIFKRPKELVKVSIPSTDFIALIFQTEGSFNLMGVFYRSPDSSIMKRLHSLGKQTRSEWMDVIIASRLKFNTFNNILFNPDLFIPNNHKKLQAIDKEFGREFSNAVLSEVIDIPKITASNHPFFKAFGSFKFQR